MNLIKFRVPGDYALLVYYVRSYLEKEFLTYFYNSRKLQTAHNRNRSARNSLAYVFQSQSAADPETYVSFARMQDRRFFSSPWPRTGNAVTSKGGDASMSILRSCRLELSDS